MFWLFWFKSGAKCKRMRNPLVICTCWNKVCKDKCCIGPNTRFFFCVPFLLVMRLYFCYTSLGSSASFLQLPISTRTLCRQCASKIGCWIEALSLLDEPASAVQGAQPPARWGRCVNRRWRATIAVGIWKRRQLCGCIVNRQRCMKVFNTSFSSRPPLVLY